MTAPTPAEQATLDRFEAAPDAEESLRERVARAMWAADDRDPRLWPLYTRSGQAIFYRLADAAIAVMRGES